MRGSPLQAYANQSTGTSVDDATVAVAATVTISMENAALSGKGKPVSCLTKGLTLVRPGAAAIELTARCPGNRTVVDIPAPAPWAVIVLNGSYQVTPPPPPLAGPATAGTARRSSAKPD